MRHSLRTPASLLSTPPHIRFPPPWRQTLFPAHRPGAVHWPDAVGPDLTPAMTLNGFPDNDPRTSARGVRTGQALAAPVEDMPPPTDSRNVAMLVAYEGHSFQGWQLQPNGPTVQGALEDALRVLYGRRVVVNGSGRTDTGVHAFNQVAHVRLPRSPGQSRNTDLPPADLPPADLRKVRASLNGLAGPHIAVKALVDVPDHFHARHRALGKHYRYQLFNHAYSPVFGRHRAWWLKLPLDAAAMRQAANHMVGHHDFSAFRARDCAAKSPQRSLTRLDIQEVDTPEGNLWIDLEANGFLQHMARIIVGTLVAVGQGKLAQEEMAAILASGERSRASATAPGAGLHLMSVKYDLEAYPQLKNF